MKSRFRVSMWAIFLSSLLGLASGCTTTRTVPSPPPVASSVYNTPLHVGGSQLRVVVANTDSAREQGLSGQQKLTEDQGMLFDFRNTTFKRPGFWMKDMLFALDFIWINNNKIIGITKLVPAPLPHASLQSLPLYYPPGDIDQVLEVNSGWSDRHNINVGDNLYQ